MKAPYVLKEEDARPEFINNPQKLKDHSPALIFKSTPSPKNTECLTRGASSDERQIVKAVIGRLFEVGSPKVVDAG